ncbi:MAG TPA: Hsp20/alpha crystallin family protein [Spirochaetota bacterium]|nr:Hsp20/alpha crystallin family protein [Spirochaetota bacterium]HPF05195.1 Hsp20/alpha crystallin family protein [Spirochaetota bacterium]HPJ41895.1 Hsp20/alpha crystallin family protein [Spirochaetota bacterium]HPR38236.1 Hsp20/alpha crystallin family protein [Spirochaetota bacterium]HRX49136.1 Hsp20/alpha crystallin family protein [Spirochaetota bacterium]
MYTYNFFEDAMNLRDIFDDFFTRKTSYEPYREFPFVKIHEGDDRLTITSLMPGIKPEDVDIQLVDDSLVIAGEKKADYEEKPYLRKERFFGEFKKSIKLPYRVNHQSIRADLKDGVLTITLEKSEDAKPKKIEIL